MQNSKTYKLYKSGKLWVVGAVAVAGVAVSSNVTHVSADTFSNVDAQAVATTDATQNDKQVQLTASSTAEKSTVPTTTGGNGSSSDNNTVPLTPTTPDTNNQGEVNHVKPIEVTPDNSGNVVDVPTQVASVPSVARAVEAYNQALTANDKDATKAPIVEAKQKLDDAVAKALPLTHATEKSSMGGNGILALAMSGLVALGGLIYKRKHL